MIIDAHNHPEWLGRDLDGYLKNMDEFGIDVTWLLSWECPVPEFDPKGLKNLPPRDDSGSPIPYKYCLAYKQQAPDRFVLGYAPDPREPDAVDKLKRAVKEDGVRVCGELKVRMLYDDPRALEMFSFCGEASLPVIVHIDYEIVKGETYWYGGGIEALENALKACPKTNFLGHAPGFWAHISGDDKFDKVSYPSGKVEPGGELLRLLDEYPNLYCDLSAGSGLKALKRDPEFAGEFIIRYRDRLLYARDFFDNMHQEFLNSLGLPDDVMRKVYSENALRLVPL